MNETTEHPPKRWAARLSLRTLLLGMVVFGLVLGWIVERARRQRESVHFVQRTGGVVGYSHEGLFADAPNGVSGPKLSQPAPAWMVERFGVDYFDSVVTVKIAADTLDLQKLKNFSSLRQLDLNGSRAVSELAPLRGLRKLEWLVLSGTEVADLSPLEDLVQLKVLYLQGTKVVDIEPLRRLTKLRSLDLGATAIKDFSALESLRELRVLSLSESSIEDLAVLEGMNELRWLDLRGTQVSDLTPLRRGKPAAIIIEKDRQVRIPAEIAGSIRRY